MWMREAMLLPLLGMRGAMFWPTVVAGTAAAAGLAASRMLRQEALRATAEATECLEDVVAEARGAREATPASGPPVDVIAGRLAGAGPVSLPGPSVAVMHSGQARLRLRVTGPGQGDAALALAERLSRFPGVRRAVARPLTGSVVLEADTDGETLAARLERAGIVGLAGLRWPHPAEIAARVLIDRLDALVRLRSSGRGDLHTVIVMALRAAEIIAAADRR